MSLRTLVLLRVLAIGLTLTFVPRVAADPPPWAGARGHSMHADGDHDDGERNHRVYRGNDPRYSKLVDRINNDRAKIAELESTGRHRKALQWYWDDLRNAERDMHEYRDHRTSNDHDSFEA